MALNKTVEVENVVEYRQQPKHLALQPSNIIVLNAVTAAGAGSAVYTGDHGYDLWVIKSASVTTSNVIKIEGCYKDSAVAADWYTLYSTTITTNGSFYVAVQPNEFHFYQRANVTTYAEGTYTVRHAGYLPLGSVFSAGLPV